MSKKSQKFKIPQVQNMLEELGLKMKLSRLRRHMTQAELARACGLSRDTIANIEAMPSKVSLENFFTVVFMLNRFDEIKDIMSPLKDEMAMAIESEEILSQKRVCRGKRKKKIDLDDSPIPKPNKFLDGTSPLDEFSWVRN